MKERLQFIIFGALVTYLTLLYGLGILPFFGSDEPRYARIGEEMSESGDYVTPTLEGRPWLEKPPLLFWLEAASFRLAGVSEFAARLPVALLSALGALALAFAMVHWVDARSGFLTYLVLVTSPLYAVFSRAASTDLPLTAAFTAAMAAAFFWHRRGGWLWAVATGGLLGLGVLSKGPVALVLFGLVFFPFLLLTGATRGRLHETALAAAALIAVAGPWLTLVWLANGWNFVLTFLVNHHLIRYATDLHHHDQPFWYYLPIVLAGTFPWIAFLPSSLLETWRHRDDLLEERTNLEVFLWIWALVPLAFFSASGSKLPGYILPSIPPLAALAALQWNRFIRGEVAIYSAMRVQLSALAALSLLLGITVVFGFHFRYESLFAGLAISVPLVVSIIWGHHEFRRKRPSALFLILVSGITLTLAILYRVGSPVVGPHHSTFWVVRAAQPQISQDEPLVLYRFFHHSARYYADGQTTPESVDGPAALAEYAARHPQKSYLLLTQQAGWLELSRVAQGILVTESGGFFLVRIETAPAEWNLAPQAEDPDGNT